MITRPPLPPSSRMGGGGPSVTGRIVAILVIVALLGLGLLLWPTFAALNRVFVASIEDYAGMVGAFFLLFLAMLLIAIVLAVYAWARKLDHRASQAAVVRLTNNMPAHVADLREGQLIASLLQQTLAGYYEAEVERAKSVFPQLHSYSSHYHNQPQLIEAEPQPPAPPPAAEVATVPTFDQLLDAGMIGPDRQLILAYNAETAQPIMGSWKDLYSSGVGALPGAGKSWVLAWLLAQSAAAGGRIILCDPHAGHEESLASRIAALAPAFMCDVATSHKEIEAAMLLAASKLLLRKQGKGGDWPIIVVVDEWTSLLRGSVGATLEAVALDLAEEGRKYNVNALLAAQGWTKATASEVRNRLNSHFVLRQRTDEARAQLGLRATMLPEDFPLLPDASGYLLPARGVLTKIVIPRMTSAGIARAAQLIPGPAKVHTPFGFNLSGQLPPTVPLTPAATLPEANRTQSGSNPANASTAPLPPKTASPEAARAAALFFGESLSVAEIARQMRGVDITKGGRAARPVKEEIERLIREGGQQ